MSMFTAVVDQVTVLAAAGDVTDGNKIADGVRNFVAPFFLLAIGIAAMSFLFKRQMTEFLQFIVLGVGVAVFFYVPGVVEKVANTIAGFF
jgi:hypothetical protein